MAYLCRQNLTSCYVHMTEHEFRAVDTVDTIECISAELSGDGKHSHRDCPFSPHPISFLCQPDLGT